MRPPVNRPPRSRLPRQASRAPNPIARIYGQTLLLLLPLVAVSGVLSSPGASLATSFNTFAPMYLIGALGVAAYRIARAVPAALWSPAFWLLTASVVFLGLAPLVETFGNAETKWRLSIQNIAITELELFQANRLSIISIFALMLGFWLHMQVRPKLWTQAVGTRERVKRDVFRPETVAIAFVVGGMVLVHVLTRPSQWGQLDIVVPGALTSISPIVDVGFALVAYLAVRPSNAMWLVIATLWPVHLFLAALAFSKSAIVIALILPALGAYLAHHRMARLLIAALLIGGVYSVSQEYVTFGRAEIAARTGTIWQAGYAERIEIASRYIATDHGDAPIADPLEGQQHWWMRLNFSNVQAMGMRFREDEVYIDSLSNVWTFFIPRAIWPDKPIYRGPGAQFYTLLTGNTGTNVGNSVIGDVYWQFGWLGTLAIMPMIGFLFAMFAWRSIEAVLQQNFIRMPLVLLSILVPATGLTKWLANGIIAMIPIYVIYLLLIRALEEVTRSQRQRRVASGPRWAQGRTG